MKTKKRTIVVAIAVSITVLAIAVGIILSLNQHKKEKIQEELVAELIAKAGSYDDSIIILNNTNKYEAAAMAKKLDAKLRITSNGHFAALYLPDGKTILDVCTDKANLKYISAITPDYNARISDLANDEESDLKGLHLPTPANYPVGDTFYLNQTYLQIQPLQHVSFLRQHVSLLHYQASLHFCRYFFHNPLIDNLLYPQYLLGFENVILLLIILK